MHLDSSVVGHSETAKDEFHRLGHIGILNNAGPAEVSHFLCMGVDGGLESTATR